MAHKTYKKTVTYSIDRAILLAFGLLLANVLSLSAQNSTPNVVFILADDMGYADISYNKTPGSLVHTPSIDRIMNEGIYFSNYVTHHVCSPTRAGILTGKHYTKVGSGVNTNGTLDNSVANMAKDFRAAGYATATFGKWHSSEPTDPAGGNGRMITGDDYLANRLWSDVHHQYTSDLTDNYFDNIYNRPWGEGVNAYGFDRFVGFYSGLVDYFDKYIKYYGDVNWWHNDNYVPNDQGYLTDQIEKYSIEFIESYASQKKPFFCYISHGAVHSPYDILRSDLQEMCGIVDDANPSLAWDNVKNLQSPSSKNLIQDMENLRCSEGAEFDWEKLDKKLPGFKKLVYYTVIFSMDKTVANVLDKIEELGIKNNTIVVFTSDNGGVLNRADNYPFRGGKHQLWEGGIHVPAAIWWPGKFDANRAPYSPGNNVYRYLTQYLDWYPTLINMSGATLNGTDLDGIDLTQHLQNRTSVRSDFNRCYFGLDHRWATVRNENWKLHYNRLSGNAKVLELYNLKIDSAEKTNVALSSPVERDTLIALADQWFASGEVTTSFMPAPYPNTDPAALGDILDVKATQTGSTNTGISVGFTNPKYIDSNVYAHYFHASDVIEYDIYVADDSDHLSGYFCSPSRKGNPTFSNVAGVHSSGTMLFSHKLPKKQWVRIAVGAGEISPSNSKPVYIGLFNNAQGNYHFYLDNVVIRKKDGGIRAKIWDDESDTKNLTFYYKSKKYTSLSDVAAKNNDLKFSAIKLSVAQVGDLNSNAVQRSTVFDRGQSLKALP